jgi:hypothetical protein
MNKLAAMFLVTAAVFAAAPTSPALAGDNSCQGTVLLIDAWTSIADCNFKTRSKVGQQILAVCPGASDCSIDNDMPSDGGPVEDKDGLRVITKMPFRVTNWSTCAMVEFFGRKVARKVPNCTKKEN